MQQNLLKIQKLNIRTDTKTNRWIKQDTTWMLALYGTAIGAGTLFLPINVGIGGLWSLIFMTILALPLTYFAHRGFSRFILSGSMPDSDITEVVEEHFGLKAGKLITFLYFFAIYPILLVYSVAITNTVLSLLSNQFHINIPKGIPMRAIFSLILMFSLISVVRLGGAIVVKIMSVLVYPFACSLMLLALYLIPNWNMSVFHHSVPLSTALSQGSFYKTLCLAIPVMVFSFNHSPIISSFSVAQKKLHPNNVEKSVCRILLSSHIIMVLSIMFFVFSCVLSLSPVDLLAAKQQNISILSYLANHFQNPIISWVAPIIAIVAISKSFFGHYLGAREGLNGLIIKEFRKRNKKVQMIKLDNFTAIFILFSCWIVATFNPSILGIIETLGGPIIAILLFLMPMYAIYKVPAMKKYRGSLTNVFVIIIGLITVLYTLYNIFKILYLQEI